MRSLIIVFLAALIPLAASAETRFVEVEVTLRTGQGTEFGIVRMIRSGTPVEVLEQDRQSGYTRIRMPGGTEGWILTRYLTDSPIGAEELVAARQRIDQLARENRELIEERNRYMGEADTLAEELARLKDLSSNAIALEDANRGLRSTLIRNEETIGKLEADNQRLRSSVTRDWFLTGAGVLGGGILLGVVLPRLRWRRKRSWSDL